MHPRAKLRVVNSEPEAEYDPKRSGNHSSALASVGSHRHASEKMNCDDCILLMAHPSHDSVEFSEHLADCDSCRELAEDLRADSDATAEEDGHSNDLIGTTIGAYEIRELIGSGGMGRVYLAVHPTIGSRVAIKVFSKDWNEHPTLVSRFFAEAHATNVIAHENIVNVLDVGRLDDGRPYLVMEFLLGAPLSQLIGTESLNDSALIAIVLDVLSALSAAHEHQIVHRDLKPDNIFVSPQGRATLLDFGIAKLMPGMGTDSAPTVTGMVLGTPHYMSPEQAVGDPVDTRTDVYAMGVILYECFTGRRPFVGGSLFRLMDQHVNHAPRPPRDIRPDLGADVEAVILKALEKLPGDRFASTGAMREALEACECNTSSGAFLLRGRATRDDLETAAETDAEAAATVAHRPRTSNEGVDSLKETAATVASRPQADMRSAAPESGNRRTTWVVSALAALGVAAGAMLLFGSEPTTTSQRGFDVDGAAIAAVASTTAVVPAADAASRAPWDAAFQSVPDAAPMQVASVVKPRPTRPRVRKARGTAPLSLLSTATRLAQGSKADATLSAIRLQGPSRQGRVDLGDADNAISFDFLSPQMAARVAERGRDQGTCIVRVTFRGQSSPKVTQVGAKCAAVRMLARPRCSVAKQILEGTQRGTLPSEGLLTSARLQVSKGKRSARAFWKFEIARQSYNVPAC